MRRINRQNKQRNSSKCPVYKLDKSCPMIRVKLYLRKLKPVWRILSIGTWVQDWQHKFKVKKEREARRAAFFDLSQWCSLIRGLLFQSWTKKTRVMRMINQITITLYVVFSPFHDHTLDYFNRIWLVNRKWNRIRRRGRIRVIWIGTSWTTTIAMT